MQWSLIKTWAKEHGYTSFREKTKDPNNPNDYDYYWGREDDVSVTGMTNSVSKLATDIYNHMTDYQWLEYQEEYKKDKIAGDITYG